MNSQHISYLIYVAKAAKFFASFFIYNLIKIQQLHNYTTTQLHNYITTKDYEERCHKENGNTYQPCGHLTYNYKSKHKEII